MGEENEKMNLSRLVKVFFIVFYHYYSSYYRNRYVKKLAMSVTILAHLLFHQKKSQMVDKQLLSLHLMSMHKRFNRGIH